MIEVIERRPDPEYYTACHGCRSKLKYNLSDTLREKYISEGNELTRKYIICPECGEKVKVRLY